MKVLSGCAMLESRDDPIPGPRGGGQSGAGEARGGQGRECSHNVGFNSQDKPGGKT